MELAHHIEILLLDSDCVIVPGLGGFMAHYIPAEYNEDEGIFYQPMRSIGFNSQLQLNDSLLAQSYVEAYDVSYPEALRMIASDVEEVKQTIAVNGNYVFHGIGTLKYTSEDRYDFTPCAAGLLTPSLYALGSYDVRPVVKANDAVLTVQTSGEFVKEEPEDVKRVNLYTLRNVLAVAMLLLFFIFSSIPVGTGSNDVQQCSMIDTNVVSDFLAYDKSADNSSVTRLNDSVFVAEQNMNDKVEKTVEESVDKDTVNKKGYYTIILASKVSKKGAEEYIRKLASLGYNDVKIYEHGTMRKVVMGNFSSETQAVDSLRKLRKTDSQFSEAWIDYKS